MSHALARLAANVEALPRPARVVAPAPRHLELAGQERPDAGAMISLRPLVPQDSAAFRSFVHGLSLESRTNRFLFPLRELAPASLQALTQPDQARHVALVATFGERIVGEARYVALGDSGHGEFALAIADHWQRRGIGGRLLNMLAAAGRRTGLAVLQGEVLKSNSAMLRFAHRSGFRFKPCPGDGTLAIVERDLWQNLRP